MRCTDTNSRPHGSGAERMGEKGLIAKTCLVLLALSLPFTGAHSQEKIVFHHLTVKDGLSQGGVNCVLQDRYGFMWFGTQDGLNRYDGQAFVTYRHDASDSTSLDDSWIIAITEDSSGVLWVRTQNSPAMLNKFDRAAGTFKLLPSERLTLKGSRANSVKPGFIEPSGVVWTGDLNAGVTRFDPSSGNKSVFRHDPKKPTSLSDDNVYSIYGDRQGSIWIGTKGGLDRFDAKTEAFSHFRHLDSDPNSLSDNWVWPILEDRSGNLWVGTYNGGLNRFDRATEKFTRFLHEEADQRSLSGNQLYSLYQDRSGLIWVGMNDHGVDSFHPELGGFVHMTHDPSEVNSLLDNNILGMYADRSGAIWVGTRGGLDRFDRARGTFTHFKNDPSNPRSIGHNLVQCLFEDRSGTLWIGTVNNGLDRYDRKTGTFTHYRNDPANPNSLSDNRVYALTQDKDGSIWVGTYRGGLNKLDPASGRFTRYLHSDTIAGSLSARGVFSLLEDREGTLWVGTFGGGLDRFDRTTNTFVHYRHDPHDNGSLSDDLIVNLHQDRNGALWIGTTGGLNKYDRSTGKFKSYRAKDGLPNDVIFGILEDGNRLLWLSTNKGLCRFDPGRKTFNNYDYNDGLQGDEFNQNAFARDLRTGEMYFGGSNGFNYFQPENIRDNSFIPQISFVAFTRYNTDDKEGKPITEIGMDVKPRITLSYKDNVANFEFAALSFYNSSKNQYAYKLDGFSDNWIQLGTQRKATFTNLEGGEYVLRVKGSNNDGVWNDQGVVLSLIVNPPWWKTRGAYAGYIVIVFGLLYSLRKFELNRREEKARVRESELRAKAMEAEKRALVAENERQTKELEDARKLQLSLLPKDVPVLEPYEIAVFMKTATEVGGDYYDFRVGPDSSLDIAFGDATGHGMQAGTIVTLMKGLFVSDSSRFDIPAFFNHCSKAIKDIRLGRLFMAFTLVRLQGNSLYLSSAGMPPVFIFRKRDGSVEEVLLKGMPLGAMKNFPYALYEASLERGDTVLLMTDGLPEQKNVREEMFDYDRVQRAFGEVATRTPGEIIAHLASAGESWMGTANQDDDITLMVVRVKD